MALPNRTNGTYEVDPISRIEGHLGIKVTTSGGTITSASAHGNLWRGFENFLLGRDINDAITYTQRICGVCPVPHGMTSTYAVDTVLGYSEGHITFGNDGTWGVPDKAVLIRNLVLSAEFLMSSITHFYHLAAPSYVQGPAMPPWTPYFDTEFYHPVLKSGGNALPKAPGDPTMDVWSAVILSYVKALKFRRLTFEAGVLFAGRMPMTSCYVGGGVTTEGTEDLAGKCATFKGLIRQVADFIVREYVPIALVLGMLYQDFDSNTMTIDASGNPGTVTQKTNNRGHGGGLGRFLAWGAFPNVSTNLVRSDDSLTIWGGVKDTTGAVTNFTVKNKSEVKSKFLAGGTNSVPNNLTEDITNSRYDVYADDSAAYAATARPFATASAAYPGDVTRTKPVRDKGYTYMKAPRWQNYPCEVGPFARMAVMGYYPVNGDSLPLTFPDAAAIYTNGTLPNLTLDTAVIGTDIVKALQNAGLVAAVQGWILGLKGGLSTMDRLRARALESLFLVQQMVGTFASKSGSTLIWNDDGWIDELALLPDTAGSTWRNKTLPVGTVQGWGATEAPRGALMHQAKITNGKIVAYQAIVPTTWNGSPATATGNGAIEAAVIGAPFLQTTTQTFDKADGTTSTNTQGGVEVLRIAQSFDPCIACAVH